MTVDEAMSDLETFERNVGFVITNHPLIPSPDMIDEALRSRFGKTDHEYDDVVDAVETLAEVDVVEELQDEVGETIYAPADGLTDYYRAHEDYGDPGAI